MFRFATTVPVCLFIWLFWLVPPASGQALFQMGQQSAAGRLIEPPRALMQQLRDAERAIAQRRFSEAVVTLGDLLQRQPATDDDDELSGQDFFIASSEPGAVRGIAIQKTLFGEARRLLGSLPNEGIETYELRYGPEARELLSNSAGRRDWNSVEEVRRRFFHTEAGRDATALLAQRAISLGRSIQALRLLDALLTHPKLAGESAAAVELARLAMQRAASGDDFAVQTAAGTDAATDNDASATPLVRRRGVVEFDGQPVTPPGFALDEKPAADSAEKFAAWLAERYGQSRSRIEVPTGNATMLGANPGRTEGSEGQMPLSIPRWMARTAATPSQQRLLEETAEVMVAAGEVAPPAWLPLKVGDQVLMRSTERLYGLDFITGKLVWQYPWFESTANSEANDEAAMLMEEQAGQTLLKQRVWNDLPYGRITSDGQRVYLLGDLAEVEIATLNPLMGFQGTRPAERSSNSLVALDLASEGKLRWRIGGQSDNEDGWGEIFFLGPPLPLGDALYVMAELSGDIVLICLDAATGMERWRQQLLAVEAGKVNNDPVRRIAGASASYHEGILVCSTGAGAIIGVDLMDQSLAWAMLIDRNEAINQNALGRRDGFSPDQFLQRWWDGTPRIVGNTIFVTPIESDRLFALDLKTGEKRWKEIARSQNGSRYLAGIRNQNLILVGSDHVRGLHARTGERAWETPSQWLDAGEQVSGVGTFGKFTPPDSAHAIPAYFVPTTSNRIVAVSLTDGVPLGYRQTQFPTGNLIAVGGQILSQSATTLSVAHGQMTLEPLVAAALENNPDDFQAIVRKAELLLQAGNLPESLRWLDRARQMDPTDVDVENLSVRAMLSALRQDFANNLGLLPELEKLIYWPADRVELIKLQVRASLERGNPTDGIIRLVELSQLVSREPSLAAVGRSGADDSSRQISLDGWVAARVSEAVELANDDQAAEIDQVVTAHLDHYSGAATPLAKRLLVHFGSLTGARPLTQKMLDRYREDNAYLAMERLVLGATSATTRTIDRLLPWQRSALAEIYARGGLLPDATALLATLSPDQDAGRVVESMVLSADDIARLSEANQATNWAKSFSVRLPQEMIRVRGNIMNKPAVGKTRRVVGQTFQGWQVVSDQSSPFGIRDPLGTVYPVPLDGMNRRDEMTRQAVFSGGLMIAMLPGELVGVNLFEVLRGQIDSVIWRRPWRTDGSGGGIKPRSESTKFGDQIYRYVISGSGGETGSTELVLGPIIGDLFYVLQGNELIAYDAMTAEPRWRNVDTPRGGAIVSDGNIVAVVSTNSRSVVHYDCRDGRRIAQLPLEDYQLWASTDEAVLMYRDQADGTRDLVLYDPIANQDLLRHTYRDLSATNRVYGRVVNGSHVVTLSAAGDILIWDIEHAKAISEIKIDPIPTLKGLQVIGRTESMIVLPNTSDPSEDRNGVPVQANSGQDHVRVDVAVINVSLGDGKITWKHSLESEPWGCTVTQAPASPLIVLSRGKSRYLTTGSRTKTIDVQAIDVRTGKSLPTLDQPVESFSNDIETLLLVQPAQQQVIVSIGNLRLEYQFSDTVENEQPKDAGNGADQGNKSLDPSAEKADKAIPDQPAAPALDDLFGTPPK